MSGHKCCVVSQYLEYCFRVRVSVNPEAKDCYWLQNTICLSSAPAPSFLRALETFGPIGPQQRTGSTEWELRQQSQDKAGVKMWGVHLRTSGRKDKGTLLYSAWLSTAELVWNRRWLGNRIMEPHIYKQRWRKTLWFHPGLGPFTFGWNPSAP